MASEWDEYLARLSQHLHRIEVAIAQTKRRINASRVLVEEHDETCARQRNAAELTKAQET
jgi:hypothetical protein